jgi:antitoxin component of RelBE/YafQ-DinJ toxin-antitoxin module
MKAAGMRIRIEQELRDEFMAVCRSHDMPAAQVIRSFIKDYVLQHQDLKSSLTKEKKSSVKIIKKE